jgi:outer membrane autotransporter protein
VQTTGNDGNATAIYDATGTLTTITNTGSIVALLIPFDDDLTDGVVPTTNGDAVAIDLTNAASGILLQQSPDAPFTDDDLVDNDVSTRPPVTIFGDIRLGAFNDTFNLEAGTVTGALSFGGGLDTFLIDNEAVFTGRLTDSDGMLNITVNDGVLDLRGGDVNGEVNILNAMFSADSTLRVLLDETAADSTLIQASGAVTFDPGATVSVTLPSGLPVGDTIVFLTAGQLFGGDNVEDPNVTGAGVPFIYNLAIERTDPLAIDGAANGLQAVFDLKSTTELGLTANQSVAFDPIVAALRLNDAAAAAFTGLDSQAAFDDAYDDLMPSFSSAAAELAATAIQQAQGASGNRLAAVRMQGLNEVSVWAQEIGYAVSREPQTLNGQEFAGYGFGMAIGIDGPLDNGALFGLSASLIASEVEEDGRPDGEIAATLGQIGAYYGTALGPIDLDFAAGLGGGKLSSQRVVEIGAGFSSESEAEWWAYEGHGMMRASVPLRLGNSFVITPQAALTYVYLAEEGYTEEGGGAAFDYEVSDATSQRLWGDVGVELSARMRMRGELVVAPRVFAGYRTNLIDEEGERSFRFVSGGDEFTLRDEPFGDGGALFGIGVDATNGYSTFTLGYEGEFGDQIERHSINAGIRFRF